MCGVSAEVAALSLSPQSASLEREYMVTSDKIVEAVKKLLK
jgi:hypothetical protein